MNVPPIGFPSFTSSANKLILKFWMDVEELTNVWLLNPEGWLKSKNT